jgi:hypothetical protein
MALNERDMGGADGNAERDPRLERLYREAAQEEPPTHLDAAILAAARREVGARPRSLSTALRRWHVPVSIAAVVVVSVSLVILVREEGGERIGETRIPPVAAPANQPAASPTPAPPVAAKVPTQSRGDAPAHSGLRSSGEDATPPELADRRMSMAAREADSAAAPEADADAQARRAELLSKSNRASPPQPAQERASAPAPTDTVASGRLRAVAPQAVEKQAAAPAADVPQARVMARAAAVKPAGDDRPPVWQGFEKEPPEKWVARIEELVREGRAGEAEAMRAEFKRRFPDHPLAQGAK